VRRVTPAELEASGLYHHQRVFTHDGRWMVFHGKPRGGSAGIYAFDLSDDSIHLLTKDNLGGRLHSIIPGRNEALIQREKAYYVLSVPDGAVRKVADIPGDVEFATAPDVTCDGRYLVGVHIEIPDEVRKTIDRSDRLWVIKFWKQHLKNTIFTVDLQTGEVRERYWLNCWIDHLQCSPTDPELITYVDQGVMQRTGNGIHVMQLDGAGRRSYAGGGHHSWTPDGKTIITNHEFDGPAPWGLWRWDPFSDERRNLLPSTEWNFHFCANPGCTELIGDGMWSDGYINHYRFDESLNWNKTRLCRRMTDNLRTEDQARFAPDYRSVFFNGKPDGGRAPAAPAGSAACSTPARR
jgi:oligogalacturonide lyase